MATLGSPKSTVEIINKYKFVFQKKFGQNFLIDANILKKIVEAAQISKEDFVLEIGPGIGTMTQYLCESAGYVAAVEIDRMLIPILEDTLSLYDNVTIINEDILKVDISGLIEKFGGRQAKVVANLPYYITTPIVMSLLENGFPVESVTIMVQKEVAERMQAGPGSKNYGALSLAVAYYAEAEAVAEVSAECFMPKPKVDSTVLKLVKRSCPPVIVEDERLMFKLIRAVFNQRRKTLQNSINNAPNLDFTKEEAAAAIAHMELPESVRGETFGLEQFAEFTNILLERRRINNG